jgi:hypothetical protein
MLLFTSDVESGASEVPAEINSGDDVEDAAELSAAVPKTASRPKGHQDEHLIAPVLRSLPQWRSNLLR